MRLKCLLLISLLLPAISTADELDEMHLICDAVASAGIATERCRISQFDHELRLFIAATPQEARILCNQLVTNSPNRKKLTGWGLAIRSPYANNKTVARCTFK